MVITHPAAVAPSAERRRFGRLTIAEPRICQVHLPQSHELWTHHSILMNISLGGFYLLCDRQPPLEKDDIRYVTLDTPSSGTTSHHFGFQVLVVRTERCQLAPHPFAVALQILADPVYYPGPETSQPDSRPVDKARIMYQYYGLNKKADEIIANTPEIRPGKIKDLQAILKYNAYHPEADHVSQSVINHLFLENLLLTKI